MIRLAFKIGAALVALAVLYVGVTYVQVWQASHRDQTPRADAIVVFGAAQYNGRPSPVLAARLDHAADLYKRNVADVVVVTGGGQPGDRTTEASASAAYLKRRGVPESALLREVQGRTSWQSLAAAANFLKQRGKTRVVLVSDPFHNARIAAMASELGLKGYVSPTHTSPIGGGEEVKYLAKETAAMALGRIVGFRRISGIKTEVTRTIPTRP
ncbi:MAG: hypothetical protein QOE35_1254 [Actinomycetota bacterium]